MQIHSYVGYTKLILIASVLHILLYTYIAAQSQIEYLGSQKRTKIFIQTKIYINLVITEIP